MRVDRARPVVHAAVRDYAAHALGDVQQFFLRLTRDNRERLPGEIAELLPGSCSPSLARSSRLREAGRNSCPIAVCVALPFAPAAAAQSDPQPTNDLPNP